MQDATAALQSFAKLIKASCALAVHLIASVEKKQEVVDFLFYTTYNAAKRHIILCDTGKS